MTNTVSRADTDHPIQVLLPEQPCERSKANDEPFLSPRVDAIGFWQILTIGRIHLAQAPKNICRVTMRLLYIFSIVLSSNEYL
jgi:hypothetical protein